MVINIKNGADIEIGEPPAERIAESKQPDYVGLLGRDYPGVKFSTRVNIGERVVLGQPLMCDRRRPEIVFTSPVDGTVVDIQRGPRRAVVCMKIAPESAPAGSEEHPPVDVPTTLDPANVRQLLLTTGLWSAVRTRPFGHIPDIDAVPKALLITAIDTEPLAVDPRVIIREYLQEFCAGVDALTQLCEAPVYVCHAPGADDMPRDDASRAQWIAFAGPHPAGLPSTHIQALCPIGFDDTQAWHIGYQDVISLGMLLTSGRIWSQRIISLAGRSVIAPRLLKVPLGADVEAVVSGELNSGRHRVMSGSVISGHRAHGAQAYLGRFHRQITALPEDEPTESDSEAKTRRRVAGPGPMLPNGDLDRVSPPGILAAPLLRALLVGDVERARDLGALELVEEDLALLSFYCTSHTDYGPLLRNVLEQLAPA